MTKTVLFVDDDPEWRSMVGTFLHGAGYRVVAASSIMTCLDRVQEHPPDLAILDIQLGSEDGRQLMQILKQKHPRLPIILFTGLDHDDDSILELMQTGAHQYVRKGKLTDLIHAVRMLLDDPASPPQPDNAG